jgi:hypothetical protein
MRGNAYITDFILMKVNWYKVGESHFMWENVIQKCVVFKIFVSPSF